MVHPIFLIHHSKEPISFPVISDFLHAFAFLHHSWHNWIGYVFAIFYGRFPLFPNLMPRKLRTLRSQTDFNNVNHADRCHCQLHIFISSLCIFRLCAFTLHILKYTCIMTMIECEITEYKRIYRSFKSHCGRQYLPWALYLTKGQAFFLAFAIFFPSLSCFSIFFCILFPFFYSNNGVCQ